MTTGFVTRYKGKIDADMNAYYQGGAPGQLVFTVVGAPSNGTSGTYANIATIGSLLIRTDVLGIFYNSNTAASPTWTALTLP